MRLLITSYAMFKLGIKHININIYQTMPET